jgi:hypothetical protein
MKNIIVKLICFVSVAILAFSCEPDTGLTPEQVDFMSRTNYGVYSGSGALFTYSEPTCQLYYSTTRPATRILQDDFAKYVNITFNGGLSAGSKVNASVAIQGISAGSFKDFDLDVLKIENDKVWIWHDRAKVGYLMPWGN